ncbi:MAG: site-specific integrase, partial [Treponema sp.]|nr:site-specific integrase [Treponema sp.]
DSKTFQITLNHTCGLPERVCAEWRRRSFSDLPGELSPYRNPRTKSDAEAGAVALIAYLKKKQGEGTVRSAGTEDITVGEFAGGMFSEGAAHIKRWKEKGYVLKPQTIAQHRRHLTGYILPRFGKIRFDEITPTAVEDYLLEQNLSNSSRNTILYTLKLVMREAKRAGIIEMIPEKTIRILERWLDRMPECRNHPGLVFPYRNKMVSSFYLLDRFRFGLDRLGIDREKRRLTVHCLRYTYNTRMKTELPGDVLREFLGHRSVEMTDHYDNPILLERLKAFQDMRSSVERFWGKKTETTEKHEQQQKEDQRSNIIKFRVS